MKNVIKFSIIVLAFCLTGNVFGQAPNSVDIDGKDYYQHGYNGAGDPSLPKSQEERDSVTVTSVIKYFVLPDPTISPDYDPDDATEFTDVKSTFTWSLWSTSTTPLGSTDGSTTPIITVTWGSVTGVDSVKVTEVPDISAACAGKGTTIPVAIIKKPEIAFTINGSIYADSACYTQAEVDAEISIPFPMTVSTQSSQVWVDYTVTKDGAPTSLDDTDVLIVGGNLTLTFEEYGRYVVTITKVTDRVSRKSTDDSGDPILGVIPAAKFAYNVMRPVQTGPIYRLPNNY